MAGGSNLSDESVRACQPRVHSSTGDPEGRNVTSYISQSGNVEVINHPKGIVEPGAPQSGDAKSSNLPRAETNPTTEQVLSQVQEWTLKEAEARKQVVAEDDVARRSRHGTAPSKTQPSPQPQVPAMKTRHEAAPVMTQHTPQPHVSARKTRHGSTPVKTQAATPSQGPTQVPSFLFCVNELPTIDNPEQDRAVDMRFSEARRWIPPNLPEGFEKPRKGDVYRWKDGAVTAAEGYEWRSNIPLTKDSNGAICRSAGNDGLLIPEMHSAATVFYCNDFDQFWTARGYANLRDMKFCEVEDMWLALNFMPDASTGISCVHHSGNPRLSSPSTDWLTQLIPIAYHAKEGEVLGQGLSGVLSILVALVAYSCEDRCALERILLHDQCWKNYRWRRHNRQHGRKYVSYLIGRLLMLL